MSLTRLLFISFLFLSACAHTYGGERIEELERPLTDLQKVASRSLPLGLRKVSQNGREHYSQYFVAETRSFKAADTSHVRSFAVIYVLGDRRPYSLEIVVETEEMNSAGVFVPVGKDQRIALVIKRKLLKELSKRREDLNMIDDFRVF